MADQNETTKIEPPSALPLKSDTGASPPAALRPAEIARPARDLHTPAARPSNISNPEGKKLTVGREIQLTGNISACDKLVVEGRVEAALENSQSIEISETGVFKGSAVIEEATISGNFEGSLTVRGELTVRSTGRIEGEIRYGKLCIESGGQVIGTIEVLGEGDTVSATPASPVTPVPVSKDN